MITHKVSKTSGRESLKLFRRLTVAIVLFFVMQAGWGQYYWTGAAGDGKWSTSGNWNTAPDGSGTTLTSGYPNVSDNVNFPKGAEINVDVAPTEINGIYYLYINSLYIPNNNIENSDFTVKLTGYPIYISNSFEIYRATGPSAGASKSILELDCDIVASELVIHSGTTVQIDSGHTANITNVTNVGENDYPAKIIVKGSLISDEITLSDNSDRILEITGGSVETGIITGTSNSVINNGSLSISNVSGSDIGVIKAGGNGTLDLNGDNTYIWKGTEDEDWANANNWTGGVPNSDTAVIRIENDSPYPTIKSGDEYEIKSIDNYNQPKINIYGKLKINDDFCYAVGVDSEYTQIDSNGSGVLELTGKFYTKTIFSIGVSIICNDFQTGSNFECENLTVNGNAKIGAMVVTHGFQHYAGTLSGDLNDFDPNDYSDITLISHYNSNNDSDITIAGAVSKITTLQIQGYDDLTIQNTISDIENLILDTSESSSAILNGQVNIKNEFRTSAPVLLKQNVYVGGDVYGPFVSDTGQKLVFNGSGDQKFYPSTSSSDFSYTTIEEYKSSGSLTIENFSSNVKITDFVIEQGVETIIKQGGEITNLTIKNGGTTKFTDNITIDTLTDLSTAGNIIFQDDVTVKNVTGQTFNTTEKIIFDYDANTTFGTSYPYSNIKHVAGPTEIYGQLTVNSIEFGETTIYHWVETNGDQKYTDAVILVGASDSLEGELELISRQGKISFESTINSKENYSVGLGISLQNYDYAISLADSVGLVNPLKYFNVYNPLEIASGCTAITTTGSQGYQNTVTIDEDVTLTSGSTITFASTIDSKTDTTKKITFEVPTDKAISVDGKVGNSKPVAVEVTQAGSITFNDTVNITEFSDTANSGDITFNEDATISNALGTTFNTSGTVTFGNASTDVITFGTSPSSLAALTHSTGPTVLNGTLNASSVTLGNTNATPGTISIPSGTINASGTVSLDGALTSTDSVSITAGTLAFNAPVEVKNITMNAVATTSQDFTVTGNWTNNKAKSGTTYGFTATDGTITFTGANPTDATGVVLSGANKFNFLVIQDSIQITGSNEIVTLTASNLGGKTITFGTGTTQTITTLNLSGTEPASAGDPYTPLTLTSSGTWNLDCPDTASASPAHTLQYLLVKNSNSTNILKVTNCSDDTGNVNWIFVGQEYIWKGGSGSTDEEKKEWTRAANWEPSSVPCLGSIITIPGGKDNYPILPLTGVNIDDGDSNTNYGSITIATGAELDFNGQALTVKSITNNGTVHLLGTETITGTMKNGDDNQSGTVVYSGSAATFDFVWDGGSDAGKQYANLIINRPATQSTSTGDQLVVNGTTTIGAASGTVNLSNANNTFGPLVRVGTSNTSAADVTLKAELTQTLTIANGAYANTLTIENPVRLQNVTTVGDQMYKKGVTITGASTIKATGTNNAITFKENVSGNNTLSLQAANINIDCSGITTDRAQTYIGAVTLGVDEVTLTSSRNITFGSTTQPGSIDGSKSLVLSVPTGRTVTFYGEVGNTNPLNDLSVTGTLNINCTSITTSGDQTYNNAVNLADGGTTEITGANVTFNNTVNGNNSLTVTSNGDGKVAAFNGNVGATTGKELTSITITGTANINCNSITTTGTQTYNGEVTIDSTKSPVLTAKSGTNNSTVTFKDSVLTTGTGNKLSVSADVTTENTTSKTVGIEVDVTGSLTNKGTTEFGKVVTVSSSFTNDTGKSATFNENITVSGAVVNNGTVDFKKNIYAYGDVTDNGTWTLSGTDSTLVFTGSAVQKFKPVGTTTYKAILIDKSGGSFATDINALKVTSFADSATNASAITFAKDTTIGSSVEFHTAETVTFTNATNVLTAGTPDTYHGITHTAGLTKFEGTITAGNVTLRNVELTGDTTLTAHGDVQFNNDGTVNATIDGAHNLTITANDTGKSITFNGNIGTTDTTKLTSLTFHGTTNINCASITTTGDQTYDGAVNLKDGGTTEITGANITFNSTVNGTNALTVKSSGSGKFATFKGNVGTTAGKELLSLTVNGNTKTGDASGISIITSGNQTYNGTVTLNKSTTFTARTTDASPANQTVEFKQNVTGSDANTILTCNANLQVERITMEVGKEIDFAGNISGSDKTLTINTPTFKSTATSNNSITVNKLVFAALETSIQSANAEFNFTVPLIEGSGEIKLETSGSKIKFTNDVTVKPKVTTVTGTTFTASSGNMTFNNHVNLANNTLSANNGTITLAGANTTLSGDNIFNILTIENSVTIAGNNLITNFIAGTETAGLVGKTITFGAGTEQTVSGALSLWGTGNNKTDNDDERLKLVSDTSGSQWKIKCTGTHSIKYIEVKDSHNTSTNYLFAINSWDTGNNTKWNFPGMKYVWEGTANNTWDNAANWKRGSIPGKGADIEIPAGCGKYPILEAALDLNETYNSHDYKGKITIKPKETGKVEGKIDLASYNLTLDEITNYGLVRLTGASVQTINGKMINKEGSTVEYYGTGTNPTNFAWDGDNGTNTADKQYANLILNQNTSSSADLVITENLTINNPASLSGVVKVTGTTTISAGNGKTVTLNNGSNTFTDAVKVGDSTTTPAVNAGVVTLKAASLITLADNANADSLEVQSAVKLQNVTTSGNQTYTGTVETITGAATIKSTTGNISFGNPVTLGVQTSVTANDTGKTITFGNDATINGAQTLSLSSNGGTTFGANVGNTNALSALTVTGPLTVNCGIINTSDNQTYKGAVTLSHDVNFTAASGKLIKFEDTVSGSGAEKLTTSTGNSQFDGNVNNLSSLTTDATVTLNADLSIGSITTQAVNINTASITTSGLQTYNGAVMLGAGTYLSSTSSNIALNTTLNGAHTITFSVPADATNTIKVVGEVGGDSSIATPPSITIAQAGTVTFKETVKANAFTLTKANSTTFEKAIDITSFADNTTNHTGAVTFAAGGTIQNNVTFNTNNTVSFTGTMNIGAEGSRKDLTHTAGNTTINGTLNAATTKLGNLTLTGDTTITTSGTQTYNGTINDATAGAHTLTLNSGTSQITFVSSVGQTAAPKVLTVNGPVAINGAAVTTTDEQNYNAAITSTSAITLKSAALNLNCSTVTTADAQTYDGPVNLLTDTTLTLNAGDLHLKSPLNGEHKFTIAKTNDANFDGAVTVTDFEITLANDTQFAEPVAVTNFAITTANNTQFDKTVQISNFTDAATAGNISFNAGGTISAATGTTFLTNGTVTFGDNQSDIMTFGSASPYADLKHTTGDTNITGLINAANITLAQTAGGPMTIANSGLFKTVDGEALTYTTSFTQNGTGNSVIGGSFTGNGNASFATNVQIFGSSQADFGSNGTAVSIAKNLIILRAATDDLNINSRVNVTENLVLYKGPVVADADITVGKDILVLGSAYSLTDTSTGITNEYAYTCVRPETWSQPNYVETLLPDGNAVPATGSGATGFTGTLSVSSGKIISAAKNFYANGTTLSTNGTTGQWTLKIPDLTNAANAFAEAYHSEISGCKIICNDGSSTDGTKSRLVCLECDDTSTTNTPNTNVDFDDFEITAAWTERDNSIRVEFNRPVRYYDATVQTLKFQNADGSPVLNFTGLYSDPDCQNEIVYDSQLSYFYIKAAPQNDSQYGAWNTDATGRSSGAADDQSTDRSGIHHENIPALDFARALINGTTTQSFIFTDRWGKRLNNYSSRTPTVKAAYGSTGDTETSHEVADKTGPVLYSVRTGQELHDAYNPSTGAAGEHSYDSHNFIEFVYSEKVDFDGSSDDSTLNDSPSTTENVQVNDALGTVKGDITKADNLQLAGLGILEHGLLHTGKNGSTDKYVSALYRKGTNAEYAIRLSIAGYTDPTVTLTDDDGYTYKKWIGYIEQATMPSGTVKHLVDSNKKNERVKDKEGNVQIKYADNSSGEPVFDTIPTINSNEDGTFGAWDLSEPVFALYRQNAAKTHWEQSEFDKNYYAEAIGNNSGVGSTLDRIEFHLYDNTPEFDEQGSAVTGTPEWFTEVGWCNPNSIGEKPQDLYKSYSYAADIFGGARPFDSNASRRTSGGIRYSTIYSSVNAFKYGVGSALQERLITTSFNNSKIGIPGATSLIFTGTSSPRRSAGDSEGLYFALPLANTSLDIKTSFTVKYDDSVGFITDLAGNRLRTKIFSTIDRTPPSIDMTVCPVGGDEMEIIFVKELCTDSNDLEYNDNTTGEKVAITEQFDSLITNCFDFITINSSGTHQVATDLTVDHTVPAKITVKENQNGSAFTIIHLKLSRTVTLDDIKNKFIRVIYVQQYGEYSVDLFTGHPGSRVTFIQDENGNNIQMYTAHALSDFAVGIINPLYAYDSAMTEEDGTIISDSLFRANLTDDVDEKGWAVHDWNRDQKNYGTLPAKRPVAIVADTADGSEENDDAPVSFRLYLSNNPDAASVSTQYNKDLEPDTQWRIWLPNEMSGVFTSLSEKNNTNYSQVDGTLLSDDISNRMIFDVGQTIVNQWAAGNQISFLFGLTNSDGTPVTIMHSPELDINNDKQYLSTSAKMPLFALRQTEPANLMSLDLWSFRLKDVVSQRGGVTILNNVINSSQREKVVVKVNQPQQGNLTVLVMTLDGSIVDYLHRGSSEAGEHFYSWDGTNRRGHSVARGMYFIRVTGPGIDETRKVMVVKD